MTGSIYRARRCAGKGRAATVTLAAACLLATSGCGATEPKGFEPYTDARPTLAFVDLKGNKRELDELKGKVVLLDFWATWCKPCAHSMAVYNTWQKELGPRGLVIVAASVDEPDAPVAQWASEHIHGPLVWRDLGGKFATALNLPTMPTAFILGRDGRFRYRHMGFEDKDAPALRATLEAVLADTP